jgi:acetyl esterase/lipase
MDHGRGPSPTSLSASRHRRALALVILLVVVTGCSTVGPRRDRGVAAVGSVPCGEKRTFGYAAHTGVDPNLTSLDVYTPPADTGGCSNRPLVVWVHGGGWTDGDKSEYMTDKVKLFNGAGYVFASINYRLTVRKLDPPAPQWPVHDQDAADALAWLVHHADEIGADPHRIAVLGHSAGGGIVAALSTDERYLDRSDLPLDTVRCAGGLDGEGYDVTAGATTSPPDVQAGYRDVFGTDPAHWQEASPIRHVAASKGIPAFFFAARGDDWRLNTQAAFIDALRKAGVTTTVIDARALEHIDLTTQVGAAGDTVLTPPLMHFLHACLSTG